MRPCLGLASKQGKSGDRGKWWRRGGSNSRPSDCEPDALPAELRPHRAADYIGRRRRRVAEALAACPTSSWRSAVLASLPCILGSGRHISHPGAEQLSTACDPPTCLRHTCKTTCEDRRLPAKPALTRLTTDYTCPSALPITHFSPTDYTWITWRGLGNSLARQGS